MRCKAYAVAMVTTLALSGGAVASARSTEVSMMDEVVVTAGRIDQQKKEVSANVTVLDHQRLQMSTARTVGDLFAEEGIGHVQKYPGSLTSIGIRGFRTDTHGNDLQSHVLILLDGRRAGTGNVAKLMLNNVERIEIIRGPGAVQYGSGGMGGVVNIITRQGTVNSVSVAGGGGSYDEWEGSLGATARQGGFDFAGSLLYRTIGDYDTGSGERFENTGTDGETGVSVNAGYTFSPGNRFGVIFTGYNVDAAGNPGYLSFVDTDDYADKDNYSVDARYTGRDASGTYRWMARYFFGQDNNTWADPVASNPDGWDDGIETRNDTDQQGAQAQLTATLDTTTLTGGLDWLKYDVENSWSPEKTSYKNPALFLLAKTGLLDKRLNLDVGLRYDWYSVQVEQPAGRDEDESHFTPKVGFAWMATESLKLRAQYAQGFMMPSADQLAADYFSWGSHIVGNPDLDPEKSNTYEAGMDYSRAGLNGSLTWFHTDFEDKIVTEYLVDGSQTWTNLGDATISGLELALSYDLGVPMNWSWEVRPFFNMTLLTRYEDDSTGEDLLYVNGTTFSTGLSVSDGDRFSARLNVAYLGSQDVQDWESGAYPAPVVELDSSTVTDLSVTYKVLQDPTWGAVSVRGEVRNVFDEDYAHVRGYPMPGRSFFAGLKWEY